MSVTGMLQGYCKDGDVDAIMKGSTRDVAKIINRSIEKMADEIGASYEDVVKKLVVMRRKEREELMPYNRAKDEEELTELRALDLSNVKKKYQENAVEADYEATSAQEPVAAPKPKAKQKARYEEPKSKPGFDRDESVRKAKAEDTKSRVKQAPVKLFSEESEVPVTDPIVYESLESILPRMGIPEAYAQRVEYVISGLNWFSYKYNGQVQDFPEGTYYVLLEKKMCTSPKDRIQLYTTACIGGRFLFDTESGVNLNDFRVIALAQI